jgi:hypothetical protein
MILGALWLLAQTVTTSASAAARPATTLFAIQLGFATAVQVGLVALPALALWAVSLPALALAAVIAFVELIATQQPDLDELLDDSWVRWVLGGVTAGAVAALFAVATSPFEGAVDPASADMAAALDHAAAGGYPVWLQLAVVAVAVGVNLGLGWLRERVKAIVHALGLSWYVAIVETGGVLGAIALVPLLPPVTFAIVVVLAVASGAVALSARVIGAVADRRARRPCPACGHRIRLEASRCPACHAEVAPARWLGQAWAPWARPTRPKPAAAVAR